MAMAGLWIAYLVPQRLRFRQQLLESRADDRFSGGLRVLRVAEVPAGARPVRTARPLLHPASGTAAREGGGSMDRPHATGDRVVADAVRRSAAAHAQRAAHLARRGAAARRRAALTALLLLLTVAGWSVVGLVGASVLLGAVPTALVAGVLVLGRRAVVAGARADAAWAAGAADRVPVTREGARAGVVGRAVHPSDAATEVMARVPRQVAATPAEARQLASARTAAVEEATASVASAQDEAAAAQGTTWAPVPVPRPTYTLKGSAPRREPAPLVLDEAASDVRAGSALDASAAAESDSGVADAPVTAPGTAPAAGLDLDAILARRRASGE